MPTITTADGTDIFYKDWGSGQPVVFSHGWPLSSDDWDTQLMFFLLHGYRVIAHDRRGHGRSAQVPGGHDMDHYADDLAAAACPRASSTGSRTRSPSTARSSTATCRPARSTASTARACQPTRASSRTGGGRG
jgi:alpha-beta hydrolase superfamily lysophospholipase